MREKRQLLQAFINRESKHRDIYHDMMPFKVREILLISSLYDSFYIDREGRFSEIMLYDYGNMNLTSLPRITGVSYKQEAYDQLDSKNIDMVIFMVGIDRDTPLRMSKKIKIKYPDIPIFMLLNNNTYIKYYQKKQTSNLFDQLFVWNGESRIFFAMIKYLEDLKNSRNDAKIASVRQILVVEDSPEFYSAFLTHLYQIIFHQTNEIVNQVETDKLYKVLKLRARPKILLANNYEQAIRLANEYKHYLFCLITDSEFKRGGIQDKTAGFKLIEELEQIHIGLPTIVLSSDSDKAILAQEKNLTFIDKNAQNLYQDLKHSVTQKIGFGEFLFKDKNERVLVTARTLKDFEKCLKTVPDESILFHAENNHFSLWLMARAEIQLAKILVRKKASEFKSADDIRDYLLASISTYRDEQPSGKVMHFGESAFSMDANIASLASGAFGGKGRGLAFVNSFRANIDLKHSIKGVKIKMPKTSVIGSDEFSKFINENNFLNISKDVPDYEKIKKQFVLADLSPDLIERLDKLLLHYTRPIAVRSSSIFEDSVSQPFAGIFETYVIPNNQFNHGVRLKCLQDAIKLVFASVFSPKAINYTNALHQKIGEEKMAIVLQELVGNQYGGFYYPHISGVAQSYNFYPFSYMKPEEGFAVMAMGLGNYVVEGEISHRFSPKYPGVQFMSTEDQIKITQTYFYAVDMENHDFDLRKGSMSTLKKVYVHEAKEHFGFSDCVSEYDFNNNRIYTGYTGAGPIIVNFASILKNRAIPISETIEHILDLFTDAFGSPVEVEFAIDLTRDKDGDVAFYILQVKPIIRSLDSHHVKLDKLNLEDALLYSVRAMGNGEIKDLKDVIYVKRSAFDKSKTEEMAREIEAMNRKMGKAGKKYILIGPGRWGTRDRWIGIPVNWTQITNAKVIVETSLEGFPLDASHGSHFFHNITSLDIAYLSVMNEDSSDSFINYENVESGRTIEESTYFKHVVFDNPLSVKIDGRKRIAAILK
jgi:hypothetical protein